MENQQFGLYSQFLGLERVSKLPDAAERGQVAHHGFSSCFVLQTQETQECDCYNQQQQQRNSFISVDFDTYYHQVQV